jgi:DNA repair exonuclease SbcCD nuclease subunit
MKKIKLIDPKNRVNLVWSTDWHLTEVPPSRRKDDYRAAILAKIEYIRGLTERLNGAGLCGGDVFHYKPPRHQGNSFRLLIDLINILRRFPQGRVFGSVGNHDLNYDRMDSLSHQPLGLLIELGVYQDLNKDTVLFTNNDETVKVSVETFPYLADGKALGAILAAGPRLPGVDHRIGIVHAYGHPGDAGSLFGEPTLGYNQLKDVDFDFLLWGHDHSRKETEQVGRVTHINLGSLARAAFSYDEVDRPVVATVLSFKPDGNVAYKEQELPIKPLEIAFQTADKGMERVGKSDDIQTFFEGMDEQVAGLDITDSRAVIHELCAGEPKLEQKILELCEL